MLLPDGRWAALSSIETPHNDSRRPLPGVSSTAGSRTTRVTQTPPRWRRRRRSVNLCGMDEAQVREKLARHWAYGGTDQDIAHEIYHDDAVLEFPQSGERFEGVENFREWRRQYPAKLAFEIRQIRGRDDLWVAENSISYDSGPWNLTVSILEFRGDKVARESIYITQTWEPPDWRAPWRAAP
jgi:hypothetical protein